MGRLKYKDRMPYIIYPDPKVLKNQKKTICERIEKAMPVLHRNGRKVGFTEKEKETRILLAFMIYNGVFDYICDSRKTEINKRGKVILSLDHFNGFKKITEDTAYRKGQENGSNTLRQRFYDMSLWHRLRCAFSGLID